MRRHSFSLLLAIWLSAGSGHAQDAPSLDDLEAQVQQQRAQNEAERRRKAAAAQRARAEKEQAQQEQAQRRAQEQQAASRLARNERLDRVVGTWIHTYHDGKSSNPDCPARSYDLTDTVTITSIDHDAGIAQASYSRSVRSSEFGKKWCASSSSESLTASIRLKIDPKYWNLWHARASNVRCSCQHSGAYAKALNENEPEHCESREGRLNDYLEESGIEVSGDPPYDKLLLGGSRFEKSK